LLDIKPLIGNSKDKVKILITGSSGYIGSRLYKSLSELYDIIGLDNRESNFSDVISDVSNSEDFSTTLLKTKPKIIIHTAAIKDLFGCQKRKYKSWKVNVESTLTLMKYAKRNNSKLILISSDMVFNGKRGNYKETDQPDPINWYGMTKYLSELLLKETVSFSICRTALVLGDLDKHYASILDKEINFGIIKNQTLLPYYIYRRLTNNQKVRLPDNIISSPTHIDLITESITRIIENSLVGTFHIAGPEALSRYDFAVELAEYFNLNKKLVIKDKSKTINLRPKNLSMNVTKTYSILGLESKDWKIEKIFNEIKNKKI